MSGLEKIEKILKEYKKRLQAQFLVKKIGIFWSYSRNEDTVSSDVDILVDFVEPIGWEFFDLKEFLEDAIIDQEINQVKITDFL